MDDLITYANGLLTLTVIPEPATLVFLGVGACLGGLRAARKARRHDIGT